MVCIHVPQVERQPGMRYKKQRLPAWCDRILWKSRQGLEPAVNHVYSSAEGVATSDHKPVIATFTLKTCVLQPALAPALGECTMKFGNLRASGERGGVGVGCGLYECL